MARLLASQRGEPMPIMAMDAMPRAALPGASGGRGARDQGDPDNISIASSAGEAAFMRLSQFLDDRLSPDDLSQALQLIQQLLGDPDDRNGNGGSTTPLIAGDSRRPGSYAQRFPNAGRLYRRTF